MYAPVMPRNASTQFPVGLFIHGGDNYVGGSNDLKLHAEHLTSSQHMVVVTINYRLGVFGWLGSRELRALARDNSTGNAGFLDQRLAMHWVQANIAAFHGDPNRVLLFGQSQGAADVSAHMVSPGSQGLFQRAMMESGGFTGWASKTMSKSQANFDALLQLTHCNHSVGFAVQCLQSKAWRDLVMVAIDANLPFPDGWSNSSWGVTIDGSV